MNVGITGHQRLDDPKAWGWVKSTLNHQLDGVEPTVIALSSLAIGADQLFASLVLNRGGKIYAVIPFQGYERTFAPQDLNEYHRILSKAAVVEIMQTEGTDEDKYLSQVPYDVVKHAKARLAYGMAIDLLEYSVTSVYVSMGRIRTEHLKRTSVDGQLSDENYSNHEEFAKTESTRYVGRAIVKLASDPSVFNKTGKTLTTGELAREYNFVDLDGTQPERYVTTERSKGLTMR